MVSEEEIGDVEFKSNTGIILLGNFEAKGGATLLMEYDSTACT